MDLGGNHVRRRQSLSPDIMNDPAFATNPSGKGKSADDPDTCRICRGEGSGDEQLFYPCKCSGSIKFVHQACLMEWLSHSQKKYCELCKTPFRFTKIYDPKMPQELPAAVFLKKLLVHACRSLLTWLRFVLVTFVWLGWLPWSMRAIWRGLFWLADGRWPNSESYLNQSLITEGERLAQLAAQGTSPAAHSLASSPPPLSTAAQSLASPITHSVSAILNFSTSEPLVYSVAKRIFFSAFPSILSSSFNRSDSNGRNSTVSPARRLRQPSWLSNVSLLNGLTPYPTLNNILIDTLEGQLITLLVVISFILVFLIREWVVQQQPAILAEGDQEGAVQLIAGGRVNRVAEPPEDEETQRLPPSDPVPASDEEGAVPEPEGGVFDDKLQLETEPQSQNIPRPSDYESGLNHENDRKTFQRSARTVHDATALHGGNPTEILRIIEQEGREEELGWVVSAMTRSLQTNELTEFVGPEASVGVIPDIRGTNDSDPVIANNFLSADGDFRKIRGSLPLEERDSLGLRFSSSVENQAAMPGRSAEHFTHPLPSAEPCEPHGICRSDVPGPSKFVYSQEPQVNVINEDELDPLCVSVQEPQSNLGLLPDSGSLMDEVGYTNSIQETPQVVESGPPQMVQQTQPAEPAAPPLNMVERVTEWLWGGINPSPPNREDGANNAEQRHEPPQELQFVPIRNRPELEREMEVENQWQDPPVAGIDPNDIDAVEDADDLEGVMELIGMHGPIFGLLQNGVFSALFIFITVAVGIWLPYLWGKIALVLLTNPIRLFVGVPLTILSIAADVTVDTLIGSLGYLVYWSNILLQTLLGHLGRFTPLVEKIAANNSVSSVSLSLIDGSSQRLRRVMEAFFTFHESDLPMFSVLSHQALRIHQARVATIFRLLYDLGKVLVYDLPLFVLQQGSRPQLFADALPVESTNILQGLTSALRLLGKSALFFSDMRKWPALEFSDTEQTAVSSDNDLARWDTKDRIIAIMVGYCFAFFLGVLYLRISAFLSGVRHEQRIDGIIAEVLQQAGGIMKVILIIGIEMIVFPLYCGILLDLALMPLFENATLMSRTTFTLESPLTSLFVHWFIGTCYMFHFALFVSMCRKIMRTGVLYFIRDPDDPTFHPVRDVLERPIATQLRKIAFSALVYGALVIICLGGVVWGLSYTFRGVLPIHWSSNQPVLEFPVDLLFYNFVMPLAIRSIRPSDGLHKMYDWWFHKCARVLRLTHFLFGEKKTDEEGHHVRRGWRDVFFENLEDPPKRLAEEHDVTEDRGLDVHFLRDGKFVRTPASDQVRIPKGGQVFLEVDENNERIDGEIDHDDGPHGKSSDMFTVVYIPPFFKLRIALFIFLIWVFAAMTGVGSTIVPLVIGRKMISSLFPSETPVNDIYAFSVGIYTVGGAFYAIIHSGPGLATMKERLQPYINSPQQALPQVYSMAMHLLRLLYISAAFTLFLPSLFALVTELYVLVPLHTYIGGDQTHVIHFVQDWTLGVLYVRMALRFILWNSGSRPAAALNAILRNGWLNPDVRLATRAFIVPAAAIASVAVLAPLPLGLFLNSTIFYRESSKVHSQVYRYCYPASLAAVLALWGVHLLRHQIDIWRVRIRDDVYLIGERLHNFGEKRAKEVGAARRMITS